MCHTFWVILNLTFLFYSCLTHQLPLADKQYDRCYFEGCTRGRRLPITSMSTGSGCLGSAVSLLHRSRQLSLQAGWFRCAGRDIWRSYSIKQSVSGLFFTHIWTTSYKEMGAFSRFLLIPREILWSSVCVSAGDNSGVSLLDTQGRRTLLHLVSKTDTYGESRSQRKKKVVRLLSSRSYFPFSTIARRNLNKVSLGV